MTFIGPLDGGDWTQILDVLERASDPRLIERHPSYIGEATQEAQSQAKEAQSQAQEQQEGQQPELVVYVTTTLEFSYGSLARRKEVKYVLAYRDSQGKITEVKNAKDHTMELKEQLLRGKARICTGECKGPADQLYDILQVTPGKGHAVEKRFEVDGKPARVYDPESKKTYDYVRVDASMKKGFVFTYKNDPRK